MQNNKRGLQVLVMSSPQFRSFQAGNSEQYLSIYAKSIDRVWKLYAGTDQVADALNHSTCAGLDLWLCAPQQGHQWCDAIAPQQLVDICLLKAEVQNDVGALCSDG